MHIIMKTVQFIFLLALVSAPAWGNNAKVDSLKQLLEQHSTADKAEVLWGIAYELFDVDNAQALFYADRAYHEVWKRGDSLQIVKVGTTYGQLLRRMGKVNQSIEISSRMLPIAKRHEYRKYWKMLLNSLGMANADKSKYDVALDYNYQSLILRQEDGDTSEILVAIQNLGFIYYRMTDYDESLVYTTKAIDIIKSLRPTPDWASSYMRICYSNLAGAYFSKRQYQQAILYYRKSLSIKVKAGDSNTFGNSIWSLADSFLAVGDLDSAKYYATKALKVGYSENDPYALANSHIIYSKVLVFEGNFSDAEKYLQRAEKINYEFDYPLLYRSILRQRMNLIAYLGRGKDILDALNTYERFDDSLTVIHGRSRINSLKIAFAQRENDAKLKAQAGIMLIQKESLERQQTFIVVVTVLLILLLVVSVALYRANTKKKEINQMLDRIVEARTRELAKHRDELQHFIDEENIRRSRATVELTSMLGSLKGLLHLAKVDPGKRGDEYLEKALGLTLQMEGVSQKYTDQARRKPQVRT